MPQFIIEYLEKFMVRLHLEKRTDLHALVPKHRPDYSGKRKVPEIVRWDVWRRDAFTCAYCLNDKGILTIDHVVPQGSGGGCDPNNLVTACTKCNQRKANAPVEKFVRRPWLKKKRRENRKHLSTTTAIQARAHLESILLDRSKTIGARH